MPPPDEALLINDILNKIFEFKLNIIVVKTGTRVIS